MCSFKFFLETWPFQNIFRVFVRLFLVQLTTPRPFYKREGLPGGHTGGILLGVGVAPVAFFSARVAIGGILFGSCSYRGRCIFFF